MTFADLATIGIAGWFAAWTLVKQDGAFDVFKSLRTLTTFGGLLECVHCCAVWTVLGAVTVWSITPAVVQVIAAMGIASIVQHWLGLDYR